jgi:hypothetical protein
MAWLAATLLALSQDPLRLQVEEALRRFEQAQDEFRALDLLSAQLLALGPQASPEIAARLAQDLRDGMATAAAPALVDALVGRPAGLEPLRGAFRDPATSAAGRVELARALFELEDATSWREGLLALLADARLDLAERLPAAGVLLDAGDPRAWGLVREIAGSMPGRPPVERAQILEFLARTGAPEARDLLEEAAANEALSEEVRRAAQELLEGGVRIPVEEPRTRIDDEPGAGPVPASAPRKGPKKRGKEPGALITMRGAVVVSAAALLALLWVLKRKA